MAVKKSFFKEKYKNATKTEGKPKMYVDGAKQYTERDLLLFFQKKDTTIKRRVGLGVVANLSAPNFPSSATL